MRRTLSRPMFRKGGTVPRQGYDAGDIVKQIRPTEEEVQSIYSQLPAMPRRSEDRSLNDFLINFGLDLISRSPSGGIFQTAAEAAKAPFAQFQQDRSRRSLMDREDALREREDKIDVIKAIMDAKGDVLGSDGGSGMFSKQASGMEVKNIMAELFELNNNQKDENKKIDDEAFRQKKKTLIAELQVYTGKNPAVDSLFKNSAQAEAVIGGIQNSIIQSQEEITIVNDQGEEEVVVEGTYAQQNPKYLADKTAEMYLKQYEKAVEQSLGLKEGGRAGYAMGEMVEQEEVVEETKPESSEGLSFEELRARLPKEITDDIINILVESPQALIEFAEIQTQDDVDQFNMKYGVNLALPSGA